MIPKTLFLSTPIKQQSSSENDTHTTKQTF